MSSPWFQLKRTTTDVLAVASAASGAVATTAQTVEKAAAVGLAHVSHYLEETETVLEQDAQRRINRRIHTLAVEDAEFYDDLNLRLAKNPRLQAHYDRLVSTYQKPVLVASAP